MSDVTNPTTEAVAPVTTAATPELWRSSAEVAERGANALNDAFQRLSVSFSEAIRAAQEASTATVVSVVQNVGRQAYDAHAEELAELARTASEMANSLTAQVTSCAVNARAKAEQITRTPLLTALQESREAAARVEAAREAARVAAEAETARLAAEADRVAAALEAARSAPTEPPVEPTTTAPTDTPPGEPTAAVPTLTVH